MWLLRMELASSHRLSWRPRGLGSSVDDLDGGSETHSGHITHPTHSCSYQFCSLPLLAFPRAQTNKSQQTLDIRGSLGLKRALTNDLTNSCLTLRYGSHSPLVLLRIPNSSGTQHSVSLVASTLSLSHTGKHPIIQPHRQAPYHSAVLQPF